MSVSHQASERGEGPLVTRRQLLKWVPSFAAVAAATSVTPELALASPSIDVSSSPAATAIEAALGSAIILPFRTISDATRDCAQRRNAYGCQNTSSSSALELVLANTNLSESRLGLGNWPLLDESEDPNLGHFTFPISPYDVTADDGTQQFLLCSNSQIIANFRVGGYLELAQRQMFDRAIWAMQQGRNGTAIVEFDRPVPSAKVERIVKLLCYYGVKIIIWGNELNDPSTPWRDNLPALFDILSTANNVRNVYGLTSVELSLPGLAYFGHGEYLQKMLSTFRDLQRTKFPAAPNDFPVQRVADHYYGPVDGLLQRIQMIRGIMAATGVTQLKYDLTEIGNPTLSDSQQRASDQQLADGYIPQIASIAIASNQVDRIDYYSLLDASDDHSLMRVQNGRLVKKPSYQAVVVAAKLLARLTSLTVTDQGNQTRVDGRRSDGIAFQILWSKVNQDLWADVPKGARVFNALGQEMQPQRPNQILLERSQLPVLAGPARIVVTQFG